ncbi:MAG: PKD domain-containing protein [Saprospirales bacterium]|nr:PKD domain-containing protein [Saprospirales bacterium]
MTPGRIILPLLLFLGAISSLHAQCPGCVITLPSGIALDTVYLGAAPDGEVGVPYDEDISFRMPMSTTPVSILDPTIPPGLPILEINIISVSNLPPGLSWEANKLTFDVDNGDTDGCVKFCGIPTLSDSFFVEVTVTANVFGIVQSSSFYLALYIAPASSGNFGFSMLNNVGCGSATVSFTNNIPSNGNPGFSYEWDFGNGNTSTLENPGTQTYNLPGVYPVEYTATVDTSGYFLTSVTIVDTDCNDFNIPPADKPDLFIIITNPGGATIYTSPVATNTDVPKTFFLNIPLGNGNYGIEVFDDELIGTEQCGSVNFNQTTTGLLIDGQLEVTVNIIHPITTLNTLDSVYVYPIPDAPLLSFESEEWCEGDSALLEVTNYTGGLQWYVDSLPIAGAISSVLQAQTPGDYWAVYTSGDGCTASSEVVSLSFYTLPALPVFSNDENLLFVTNPANLPLSYSLQWYQAGTAIPGATDLTYCITGEGSSDFSLEVTDLVTGCTNEYNSQSTYDPQADCISGSSEEFAAQGALNLYPNPVFNELTVEMGDLDSGVVELAVLNGLGQTQLQFRVEHPGGEFVYQVPAHSLLPGWYVLLVKSSDGTWMARAPFVRAD